jgi:hypothetical protein
MAETKHVGRLKANQRRVVVAYRVIPGEETPTNSLVIDTASLTDADHDTLIKTVEGPAGQEGSTLTEAGTVNEMPATTKVQAEAQAANIQAPNNAAITDEQLAASYRSQADSMFKEAKRLREQAEELVPTKKSKASAKTAS